MKHTIRAWTALVLALLLTLALSSCTPLGKSEADASQNQPKELSSDVKLFEKYGLSVAIPNTILDQLLIKTDLPEEYLLSVYEKRSYEDTQKDYGADSEGGYLFSIVRYTRAQYEKFLMSDGSGQSFFAKDDTYYYGWFTATDVQFYRSGTTTLDPESEDLKNWQALFDACDGIKADFIQRNKLTPYSDSEFFDQDFTYDSSHQYVTYYPYFTAQDTAKAEGFEWQDVAYTLVLSQPKTQGEGGIWCVERWYDDHHDTPKPYGYYYFPNTELTASEYYTALQSACDSGKQKDALDPIQACISFVSDYFGRTVPKEAFSLLSDKPSWLTSGT